MSTILKYQKQVVCPVELALRVLGGKWKGSILYQLKGGSLRYTQLKNRVQEAVVDYGESDNYLSNKVLSGYLSDFQAIDLVEKIEVDGHDEYELTAKGESAIPILEQLYSWGEYHFQS